LILFLKDVLIGILNGEVIQFYHDYSAKTTS